MQAVAEFLTLVTCSEGKAMAKFKRIALSIGAAFGLMLFVGAAAQPTPSPVAADPPATPDQARPLGFTLRCHASGPPPETSHELIVINDGPGDVPADTKIGFRMLNGFLAYFWLPKPLLHNHAITVSGFPEMPAGLPCVSVRELSPLE